MLLLKHNEKITLKKHICSFSCSSVKKRERKCVYDTVTLQLFLRYNLKGERGDTGTYRALRGKGGIPIGPEACPCRAHFHSA